MKKIKGAITALVTPFDKKGNIDIHALKNLVYMQLAGNIDGIVACGSTGEAATMTHEEYELVIKTVVETVKRKIPVIAGAGSNDTQKAIVFSKLAKKAGADVLLHVNPFYNKPTVRGLIAHYKAIADAVDMPIFLYNVPSRTGLNITAQATVQIAKQVPQVIGTKEASANIPQMMEIIHNTEKNFTLLSGDDTLALPIMAIGGMGCISVVSNEVPKSFTAMITAALENNWKKAKKIHYQLHDLMNINFIETNPLPVKTALAFMGKIQEMFRLPLVPMEEHNKETLKKVLGSMALI